MVYGGERDTGISVNGVNEYYFIREDKLIKRGRSISILDVNNKSAVCLIGADVLETFFYGVNPLEKTIYLNGIAFSVIGLLGEDATSDIIIPYTTALKMNSEAFVKNVTIYLERAEISDQVVSALEPVLDEMFSFEEDTYSVNTMEALESTMTELLSMMSALLAGIASIALIVGGIGIMIMMLILSLLSAFSEELTGKTVFLQTHTVYADFEGTIERVYLTEDAEISAGDQILSLRTSGVYADFDATVRGVSVSEGEFVSSEAFQLEPKEKYRLLGSVTYAYDASENQLVHAGEKVYVSCVKDATHLAIGYIANVDDDDFTVYTTHGTLYVGEAVNVFRDSARNYLSRIGRATVYAAQNSACEIEGTLLELFVREGERVEKGEILMEYLPGADAPASAEQYAETDGIVTGVYVRQGDRVSKGDKLYEYALAGDIGISVEAAQADMNRIRLGIVESVGANNGASVNKGDGVLNVYPDGCMYIEFTVNEMDLGGISEGDKVEIKFLWNEGEAQRVKGEVTFISLISNQGTSDYTARASFEEIEDVRLGMTAVVYTVEDMQAGFEDGQEQ